MASARRVPVAPPEAPLLITAQGCSATATHQRTIPIPSSPRNLTSNRPSTATNPVRAFSSRTGKVLPAPGFEATSPKRSFFPRLDFPAVTSVSSASSHHSSLAAPYPSSEWTFSVTPVHSVSHHQAIDSNRQEPIMSPRHLPAPPSVTIERQFGETDVRQIARERIFADVTKGQWRRRRLFSQKSELQRKERLEAQLISLKEAKTNDPLEDVGYAQNLDHPRRMSLLLESGIIRNGVRLGDGSKTSDYLPEDVGDPVPVAMDPELEAAPVPPLIYRPWSRLNQDAKEATDAVSTLAELSQKSNALKKLPNPSCRSKEGCVMANLLPEEEIGLTMGENSSRRPSYHRSSLSEDGNGGKLTRQLSVLRRHTQQLPFTVSPKRRKAKVVMIDERIGGLLYDEEAVTVIPFTFGQSGDDHVSTIFSVSDCVFYQRRTETESGSIRAVRMMIDHQQSCSPKVDNIISPSFTAVTAFGGRVDGVDRDSDLAEDSERSKDFESMTKMLALEDNNIQGTFKVTPPSAPSLEYTDLYQKHLAILKQEMMSCSANDKGPNDLPETLTQTIPKQPLNASIIYSRLSDRLAAALLAEAEDPLGFLEPSEQETEQCVPLETSDWGKRPDGTYRSVFDNCTPPRINPKTVRKWVDKRFREKAHK